MGAKEDLIKKLQQRANAERLKDRLLAEQHALFVEKLPDLYKLLEGAVDGVPGVEVSHQDHSADMDRHYPSLIIEFLGSEIRFDPISKNGEYGVRARNLDYSDLLFLPTDNEAWTAEVSSDEVSELTEDLIINRLSKLLDEDSKETIHLWD
ncbi:hypothetical protein [Pseudomonas sp. UBA6753]|uniref:hypothetical protein n=1 Tax=Pseudomonas sp. UBA6753 TaxID=1947336 RepID=UPI00257EAC1B|nr:hypothetical protein [Pseudomonas sp. UBA6753]